MKKSPKTYTYWVDIVGACNLRCPSCPRGNFQPTDVLTGAPPAGLMDFQLYKDIVQRIKFDGPSYNPQIHLYNWGEPLVHPDIGKFIKHARDEGVYCGVSSNLNFDGTLEDVVKARPDFFRVSLSGFNQETYGRTHRRGNIERVKDNMRKLRRYMTEYDKSIYVEVNYHVYKHNANDDLVEMIAFCNELNFNISPVWAFFLPLEKNLALADGEKLADSDNQLMELFAIPPEKAMALAQPYKDKECPVREHATVINFDGSVPLCCNTYDQVHLVADSFLEIDHEALQAKRYSHPTCKKCMDAGIHAYLAYQAGDVMDEAGNAALREVGSPLQISQYSAPHVTSSELGPVEIMAKTEDQMRLRKKIRGLRLLWWRLRNLGR